ncbi:MAG: hypothetical protein DCF25_18545 [Leptolyngbya foveolarum]|uniref:Uncharacterized protein n=1 Tax=Leptolyngbya foveolarum TaxID=47253 RepID=A0A2W4TYU9_9CYAN|nr:MAG: hypothetical protein DCF25_18545 [Leptolyngbya foveolarum]
MSSTPAAKPSPEHKPVTAEQIDRAIAWYEANVEAIAAALPISTPGVLYKAGCLESLSRSISTWKNGTLPLNLAGCYIHRPISFFYKELTTKS